MPKAIRFKVPWQGRARGSIDRVLAPGIMQTLVDHHKAEWCEQEDEQRESEPQTPSARHRRKRR